MTGRLAEKVCVITGTGGDGTRFDDPSWRHLSFVEHRLPEDGLFKVPEYDTVDLYVLERDWRGTVIRVGDQRAGHERDLASARLVDRYRQRAHRSCCLGLMVSALADASFRG